MYVIHDPDPARGRTADQQRRYDVARAAVTRLFDTVQYEYARATQLDTRGDDDPLTAPERLELASLCAVLASTFNHAADIWQNVQAKPQLAITAAYRQQALDLRDADALHTAVAEIAPAGRV